MFTPHGRPESPHCWHIAFPGTNRLRGGLCRFERQRTLGRGGGAGGPGGREELGLGGCGAGRGGCRGVAGTGGAPRGGRADPRRVPPPRRLLEHRAGRSTSERAAAHRCEPRKHVLASLGLRTETVPAPHRHRRGNKHSLSACTSKQSRASQHRPPEPALQAPSSLGNRVTEGSRVGKNPGRRMRAGCGREDAARA